MNWQLYVTSAENVIASGKLPSSQEIITLIKRVNPTSLPLSETDRRRGYAIKRRLQNLLLENYGEIFHLAPHPTSPDIVLIKHNLLPLVHACHAYYYSLSEKALCSVASAEPGSAEAPDQGEAEAKLEKAAAEPAPMDVLREAKLLLEQYEYPQAEELLASLRVEDAGELPTLVKAVGMLVEEMGAYQRATEVLLAQPTHVLKDKSVRELLAVTYYGNGMFSEARVIFDALRPADLGKNSLYAYADISFKDGNISQAYQLLKLSEQKEGFVTAHASLRKEIEAAMLAEAVPFFTRAEAAFAAGDVAQAESLLQEALSLYPDFQKARQLAAEIEASKTACELSGLWARLASTEAVAARLDLLAQLLERDKANGVRIKELIEQEKARQKRETVDAQLHKLQAMAAQQKWAECFPVLAWLSREADEESCLSACRIDPLFSVLYRNKRLQRLPDQEAKDLWLSFVRLKELVRQGRVEGCWDQARDLKHYFYSYPDFQGEYDRIFEQERGRAREEVRRFLTCLEELSEGDANSVDEARTLLAAMRKRFPFLPAEEAAEYDEAAQSVLRHLEQEVEQECSILDYHDALLFGNAAKAAQLLQLYGHSWQEGLIKMAEDQIREKFAISAEPVTLDMSPDTVVDLAAESAPVGLKFKYASSHHLLFREDQQTMVVVDLRRMCATRYRSPNFEDLEILEILPDKDLFLFFNATTNNTVWRAVLSERESRFTAQLEINEHFTYGDEAVLHAFFMSGGKENVYYTWIKDGEAQRFVKQNVGLVSSVERVYEIAGAVENVYRLSYQPDRFVIVTESNTIVLESNLTPVRGCSRIGRDQKLSPLAINPTRSEIYALGDGIVNVVNTRLRAVKQYLKAATVAYMQLATLADVCVEKSTAVMQMNGKGTFYNMDTNKFSQKFTRARVLSTQTPSRWYYWDFDAGRSAILLKDITEEVGSLLEWQVLLPVDHDEAVVREFVEKWEDPTFFTVAKPAADTATAEAGS